MKKTIQILVTVPVSLTVDADDDDGDVIVRRVRSVKLPDANDVMGYASEDDLAEIDRAFAEK